MARLRGQPGRPSTEIRIAGVGPLVSVILGLLFGGLALLANRLGWPEPVRGVSSYLAQVNLLLAGFNLVLALPLDGGRVLRAWLWDRQRSYYRATRSAVRAGKAICLMLIALGVLGFLTGTDLGGLWFVLLGWFLIQAAQGEMEQAEARQALRGLRVRDVMRTGAVTVSPDRSVAAFLDDAGRNRGFSSYPVVDDRGLAGMVSVRKVATVPAGQRQDRQVDALITPADQVPTVRLDDPAEDTLGVLGGDGHRAVVLDDDGRIVGMLTAADVARAPGVGAAGGEAAGAGGRFPQGRATGVAGGRRDHAGRDRSALHPALPGGLAWADAAAVAGGRDDHQRCPTTP